MDKFAEIANRLSETGSNGFMGLERKLEDFLDAYFATLLPKHFGKSEKEEPNKRERELRRAYEYIYDAIGYVVPDSICIEDKAMALIEKFPTISETMQTDILAAYQGDPAAHSYDEIILTYPSFKAIGIYRVAHELYLMKMPILPRMLSEYAHRLTGIDIHPGATIGKYFFIDHGTGVVIGETTTIGEYVKLYQHVTLGAKNFEVAEDGSLVKGIKRHPDIGNHVVIYAGATILGGNTHIGDNCVIGGNVWITKSVEAGTTVTVRVQSSK